MLKRFLLAAALCSAPAWAQETQELTLTAQEAAVAAAIKAQNTEETDVSANAKSAADRAQDQNKLLLPESTKAEALAEQKAENAAHMQEELQKPAAPVPPGLTEEPAAPQEEYELETTEEEPSGKPLKCLTVAFIDIDEAFDKHPRTVAVKQQIHLKIVSKEQEVDGARQIIDALRQENAQLTRQLRELKPFYRRIMVEQEKAPVIEEKADSLFLGNLLNQLTFSGCEILTTTPLNTPAQVDDIAARIAANKKIIAERSYFIDNYKYTTREEILKLEEKEVKAILKDIYTEIKSFAKKRNIGAVVRKDEILYGEKPVNVTKDFISRLKKSKKYRKMGY